MQYGVTKKSFFEHVKSRKFIYFSMVIILAICWYLIGYNSVKPTDGEELMVWVTNLSIEDDSEYANMHELLEKNYKKWGYKGLSFIEDPVLDYEDKRVFSLYRATIDFYIITDNWLDAKWYMDLNSYNIVDLVDDDSKIYKDEDGVPVAIKVSENYYFAVSAQVTMNASNFVDICREIIMSFGGV